MDEIDEIIKHRVRGYKSRAEFIKEAIRKRFEELKTITPTPEPPQLERFNISEEGVRILDRSLANETSRGRIIDVYFKPEGVWCEYCESTSCRHVEFALNIPEVKKILRRKGWKIEE